MSEHTMTHTIGSSDPVAIFSGLADRPIWVPWYPKHSTTRPGKTDKIPAVKTHRLSTKNPQHWMSLPDAFAHAAALKSGGVGLVLTGGITNGDYTLVGFDIDDATENYTPPFETYTEYSPSGKGLRFFAWVESSALQGLADTTKIPLPHCDHAEIYFGTAERFLTITFDSYDETPFPIKTLDNTETDYLLSFLQKEKPLPKQLAAPEQGSLFDFTAVSWLTTKHRLLLAGAGRPDIDRSTVLASLLATMSLKNVSRDDAYATMLTHPVLAQICTDHRPAHPEDYALREIDHAYAGKNGFEKLREVQQTNAPADKPKPKSIFLLPSAARISQFTDPHKGNPPFIVANAIPVDNGVMAGAGGTGKSTVCLWEAVHIILGKNVWGNKVLRPGPVLFLTAEDGVVRLKRRLDKIMDAMHLSTAERAKVEKHLFVQDLVGKNFRLAYVEQGGTVRINEEGIDELVSLYAPEGISVVNIDPLSHFSAGERFVNDNESSVNAGAARISKGLNCFVRLVAHVSKAVHREGIDDQYAGRGGAALADNARQMMQLKMESDFSCLPKKAYPLVELSDSPLVLGAYFHKVTDAPPWSRPIYLVRNGWRFWEFMHEEEDVKTPEQRNREDIDKIKVYIKKRDLIGVTTSVRDLKTHSGDVGVKKNTIETLVSEAMDRREIAEEKIQGDMGPPKKVLKVV